MARTLVKKITDDKNYLINGAFDFWQRNVGTAGPFTDDTSLSYKGPDRWRHRFDDLVAASTVHAWARIFDAPVTNNNGSPSAFRHIFRRGNLGIYNMILQQRIEAFNSRELLIENPSGKMSIGCWVKSDTATSVRITILTPTALDNHTSQSQVFQNTFTLTPNSTWQQIKYENLSVPANANLGLAVQIEVLTPAAVGADGVDHDIRVSMAQLNRGEIVAPFQRAGRTPQQELALCQRYYKKSYDHDVTPGTSGIPRGIHRYTHFSTTVINDFRWTHNSGNGGVQMRTFPLMTTYSYNGLAGRSTNGDNEVDYGAGSADPFNSQIGQNNHVLQVRQLTGGNITLTTNQILMYHWTMDAEL